MPGVGGKISISLPSWSVPDYEILVGGIDVYSEPLLYAKSLKTTHINFRYDGHNLMLQTIHGEQWRFYGSVPYENVQQLHNSLTRKDKSMHIVGGKDGNLHLYFGGVPSIEINYERVRDKPPASVPSRMGLFRMLSRQHKKEAIAPPGQLPTMTSQRNRLSPSADGVIESHRSSLLSESHSLSERSHSPLPIKRPTASPAHQLSR